MIEVDLQWGIPEQALPSLAQCTQWVAAALLDEWANKPVCIGIRIVSEDESQALNRDYRHQDKPTNVLSFPFEAPPFLDEMDDPIPYLGDLAICAQVVAQQAEAQHKTPESHWAHMVVHGTLHLQGLDHVDEAEAEAMEALEIELLNKLGYPNPYLEL